MLRAFELVLLREAGLLPALNVQTLNYQPLQPDAAFSRDVETLIAEAELRRPDLKAAEAQVRAAEAGVDLAQAQGRPTLTLSAAPVWAEIDNGSRNTGVLGLTLDWRIPSDYRTVSAAITSGAGRLSESESESSFSQKMSRLALSRAMSSS